MDKRTSAYIHTCINDAVEDFILSIAAEYNPDWNTTPKAYVNLIRDRVYKQLKQYEEELIAKEEW